MYDEVLAKLKGLSPKTVVKDENITPDQIDGFMFGKNRWERMFGNELGEVVKWVYLDGSASISDGLAAIDSSLAISFDMENPRAARWFDDRENKIKGLATDRWDGLRDDLAKAVNDGATVRELREIVKKWKDYDYDYQAETVARTEAGGAYNGGSFHTALESEVINYKEWLTTIDDRTRDSHRAMSGEIVRKEEPFSNGAMYPGGSGIAEEDINCRCAVLYHYELPAPEDQVQVIPIGG